MTREEISNGVGNIKDQYIQEAADYSVSDYKNHATKRPLIFERARFGFRNASKSWLKLGIVATCIMLMICSVIEWAIRKPIITEPNETAYKPAIMYDSNLYLISSQNPDSFQIDESELVCVGTIKDVIAGTSFPTKNFQSSGNEDLLGCDVYIVKKYPKEIFVYDHDGELFVYDIL